MAKKSLETKLVDVANELLKEEYNIADGSEEVEVLVKEMELTRKYLEQLAFMLKKYKGGK